MPGIRNFPAASIRSAPAASASVSAWGATAAIRLSSIRTLPRNGAAPLPSQMLALSISTRIRASQPSSILWHESGPERLLEERDDRVERLPALVADARHDI